MTSEPRIDFDLDARASARIVLIGFMGAGKTTVARRWACAGGPVLWFDSDAAAACRLGVSDAAEAFSHHGEAAWRQAEREVVVERAAPLRRGVEVWSLGGGAVLDPEIQRAILDSTVVWLDAPVEELWRRVSRDGAARPLAAEREEFGRLYTERREVYDRLASCRVDATGHPDELGLGRVLAGQLPTAWFGSGLAVGRGLLARVDELGAVCERPVAIVADEAVGDAADVAGAALRSAGVTVLSEVRLPMGEWHKQLSTAEGLLRRWSSDGVHRQTTVLAIGGGTLLDVAGFAASVYQRGLAWVSVPTTVTSQVDAGVGGKTGVNLDAIKNVVGTVHQPRATVIDPDLLVTLDRELVLDGFVEAAKTALLAGDPLLARARRVVRELRADTRHVDGRRRGCRAPGAGEAWLDLIEGCAAWKDAVVAEDPFDTDGIRAQLNLGHTLGHAIEAATGGATSHGAAVAVGIAAALELSVRELHADRELPLLWRELCEPLGIELTSTLRWDEVEPALVHDKKRGADGIGWVLLERPGCVVTEVRVPAAHVRAVWEEAIVQSDGAAQAPERGVSASVSSRLHRHDGAPVLVLFGANLGELGRRDQAHYGNLSLAQLVQQIQRWAEAHGLRTECRQTDSLERFLAALHEARTRYSGLLVNPGAWTHHERSLHDAIEPLTVPVVEVHLSDIAARESWRRESVIERVVDHRVCGAGPDGYRLALEWLVDEFARRDGAGTGASSGAVDSAG